MLTQLSPHTFPQVHEIIKGLYETAYPQRYSQRAMVQPTELSAEQRVIKANLFQAHPPRDACMQTVVFQSASPK